MVVSRFKHVTSGGLGQFVLSLRIPGHRERRFQPKVNIHSKAS